MRNVWERKLARFYFLIRCPSEAAIQLDHFEKSSLGSREELEGRVMQNLDVGDLANLSFKKPIKISISLITF